MGWPLFQSRGFGGSANPLGSLSTEGYSLSSGSTTGSTVAATPRPVAASVAWNCFTASTPAAAPEAAAASEVPMMSPTVISFSFPSKAAEHMEDAVVVALLATAVEDAATNKPAGAAAPAVTTVAVNTTPSMPAFNKVLPQFTNSLEASASLLRIEALSAAPHEPITLFSTYCFQCSTAFPGSPAIQSPRLSDATAISCRIGIFLEITKMPAVALPIPCPRHLARS
mmetsp:Transcript_7938/g.10997  ORF Transcript_7938/g.10997 Transcript_7938/m.10997 type:complete len:226 (-) Transcript_7938:254-931(-)